MVTLLGLPFDHNSSFLRGPALAPALIREALFRGGSNLYSEDGTDLKKTLLEGTDIRTFAEIEATAAAALAQGQTLLGLGGDHSISRPLIAAHAEIHPNLTVVQFDAHPDLYPDYEGNLDSHACPFARLLEEGAISQLIQVGIRTQNPVQQEMAERFGVVQIEMRDLVEPITWEIDGPLYISLDLDVLDPAFAPGVSHHEPGGLSSRQLLRLLASLPMPVGADLVEFNPLRDPCGITAAVAAKLCKELTAMLSRI